MSSEGAGGSGRRQPARQGGASGTAKRVPLSRAAVVSAAVAFVDAHGVDELSLRRLGAELQAGAMTLYWHVHSKIELLDLVLDAMIGEVELPPLDGDWTERMTAVLRSIRSTYLRHRKAAVLVGTRPATGPNAMRLGDAMVGVLRDAGFCDSSIPAVYQALLTYASGTALFECIDNRGEERPTPAIGPSSLDEEYPNLAALADVFARSSGEDSFEYGLQRLLEGLNRELARQPSHES